MAHYAIPPYPALLDPDVQVSEAAIRPEIVAQIREYGDRLIELNPLPAMVGFHEETKEVPSKRHAITQWLKLPTEDPTVKWMYDMVGESIQQANARAWQYDVWGFDHGMHYVQYHEPGDHFGYHQDRGDDWRLAQRKLSCSIILSDPDEYEGGEFQIMDGGDITIRQKAKGTVIVFPSFIQHRVLPVTKGVRRALVAWVSGPRFK